MAATTEPLGEFPVWGLLPRKETGVVNLLSKNPTYDGRGVVIAVFDSGVDPGAPGLQVTTEGKVKVIERIDASGAGDVDTSTVVEAVDGVIDGLTGRKLKVPESWNNPNGKYHLGVKGAFSLYPRGLRDRIIKERKDKNWDPVHKVLLAESQRKLQAIENSKSNGTGSNGGTNFLEKLIKEDAEARVALLNSLEKKHSDLGPAYDCVVYNDGEVWRACIDTTETGDLEHGIHLGEYRVTHQWASLTKTDQYNISINVHNDGNILEIVGMCSSHGTHVASIASANFPDNPEKNGVAPGAQVVSITIGDNRIGSMETGTALARAMIRVMENPYYKVDVINMSYGEHAHWSNSGRLGELAGEVINKYGVIWVASAGNHGPALATVGVPPDFQSDSIIGVGAYVSPDMMVAEYSMLEKLPGCPYTWSSRGPTADGARGVTVCAPGGAITSVPSFTLRSSQLMNGTSMASPHTAGCVALLVSSLKIREIPYSPYSVRRAIQNTALALDTDIFAQGHGLIQVERAVDYLIQHSGGVEDKVRFVVECGAERSKGIHLRNWMADKPVDVSVMVEPVILDDTRADPSEKLQLNMELVMSCDAPWVRSPACLQLSYTVRVFQVSIDPRGLERGRVYSTCVRAYNSAKPDKGVMFEVPITVVVPLLDLDRGYHYEGSPELFRAGQGRRLFIQVPQQATWASVTLKASHADKCQRFTFHAVQLKPNCSVKTLEFYKTVNLSANESTTLVFAVRGCLTIELCLARWWCSLVDGQVQLTCDFHSLCPSQEEMTLLCSEGMQRVDVRSGLRQEELNPQAVLKHHAQVVMPADSKVEVLGGERDTVPNNRPVYQLILTYNLSISKSAEITPKSGLLSDVLYEAAYESQLWMVFDSNKHLLGAGDAYSNKYSLKLEKGDYVVRLHVRHERSDLLEKLTDLPLTVMTRLSQEVKLDIYSSFNALVTGGKKTSSVTLSQSAIHPLYLAAPSLTDKNLKSLGLSAGQALIGTMSFAKDEQVRKAVSSHKFGLIRTMPDCYPLRVVITELPCKKRTTNSNVDEKKESKSYNDYTEAVRDLQTAWIPKLDSESSEKVYQEVLGSHPDHLAAQLSRLQALDAGGAANRQAVITLAKSIIAAVDTPLLLAFYGTKTDTRTDANKIKTQMDKQRNILLEALSRQGTALGSDLLTIAAAERSQEAYEQVDQIAMDILKFVEPTDSKVNGFFSVYYQIRSLDGLCCRLLSRQCDDKWSRENEAKLTEGYTRLGWTHAATQVASAHPLRFPTNYAPF
ncbi:unnamed protein product [Meganyctiphanes norvegica]|uniref:Tripeptidyl-peptidase 2 n=1 Tax=Meganyctiphanes norvegica TaxID=48144 RepID=A0AAV2Q787_MEGNR